MHNFMTTTIISDFFEPIIMQGMLIYGDYNTLSNNQAYWEAIDLATGQTVWQVSPGISAAPTGLAASQNPNLDIGGKTGAESLRMGEVVASHSMQEYGSMAVLYSTSGTTWRLYSAFNGMYIGNITGVGTASYIQDNNPQDSTVGTILGYYVGSGNLTMWNSTLCWGNQVNPEMLRPPSTVAWSRGTQWNVTLPTTFNGNAISPAFSISRITHDVILLRSAPSLVTYDSAGYAVEAGYNALTGQQLWIHNVTIPAYHYDQVLTAGQDVYILEDKDATTEYGYSMTNGSLLWGPTQLPFNALSTLSQAADIAYGNVYTFDLGGYCTAINLVTGKIAWVYSSPSAGYNTPYGIYPIWQFGSASIAGGELFFSLSRMYDPPLFENATRLALNATTGKPVWDILSFSGRGEGAIGDGYLVSWNSYDAKVYTFGRGPSQITAAVQNSGTTKGNDILITGMVTDISPGTKQAVQAADFPQGVPCVADSSMSDWMEYVYMQQPCPTNVTGVPVILSVLDSNGNYRTIGTATTDALGFYSYTWTPEISGKYTVYASFAGTQSYWPANTETAFTVAPAGATPAPTASPIGNLVNTSELTMYIAAAIIVMVIALAIATLLILRKHP